MRELFPRVRRCSPAASSIEGVDVLAAGAFLASGAVAGAVGGAVLARRRAAADSPAAPGQAERPPAEVVDAALGATLTGVVVLAGDDVVWANPSAASMRLVKDGRLAAPELAALARKVWRAQEQRHADVDLPLARAVHVVAAPAGAYVALLVDDTTDTRRVDTVRKDFVANVSHELKTPVGAISLLAEALRDCGDDPEAVRRFADRTLVESRRLSRLIQELIDLSRLEGAEPTRFEPVDVRAFVDEAVDRARLAADAKRIEVVVHVAGPDLVVNGDATQLCTALTNLLDNAIAYSPDGKRVGVAARRRGGDVEVSVSDQGIGIGPADRERVFERFYRVDSARSRETGGTGLGLALVKHIAGNHGGRVDVWSVEGTGSTFTITLPAASVLAQEGAAS